MLVGQEQRLRELPRQHRRGAEVEDLARLHHVVQRLERLLDRHPSVPAVRLVQVDVVGAQAAEAVVDLLHDVLAGQAHAVGSLAHRPEHLGGDHDLLAVGEVRQGAAHDLLAGAVGVHVGRVEEVDAGLDRPLDVGPARLLVE